MHIICGHTRQFVLVALLGGIVFRSGMFADGYKRIDIFHEAQEKINHKFLKM